MKKHIRFSPKKTKDLPLNELYKLMDQHKSYLKFLQENDMCTDKGKTVVVNRVMSVYEMIPNRSINDNDNILKM